MNFRTWLYNEISDIANRDTSGVHLRYLNGDYFTTFQINNQDFRVDFASTTDNVYGKIYEISFKGPNEHSLTGTAGTTANVIYTQLLLSVKKLMETVPVMGFSFIPAASAMRMVYQRFFEQFLKKDFMQVGHDTYIKKDKIREVLAQQNNKKEFLKDIMSGRRYSRKKLQSAKEQKKYKKYLEKQINTFFNIDYYSAFAEDTQKICFLLKIMPTEAKILVDGDKLGLETVSNFTRFDLQKKPTYEEIHEFLDKLAEPNYNLVNFFNSEESTVLKNIMKQYGIAEPESDFSNLLKLYSIVLVREEKTPAIITNIDKENQQITCLTIRWNSLVFSKVPFEKISLKEPREDEIKVLLNLFTKENDMVVKNVMNSELGEEINKLMRQHGFLGF